MTDRQLAERIVELAGGTENIAKAVHCVTRLRLYIKDQAKFDKETILEELGLTVMIAGGQNQIIIGPGKVNRIYAEVIEVTGLPNFQEVGADGGDEEKNIADLGKEFQQQENLFNKFVALVAGIFQPILGILAGSGMIKGMTALLVAVGVVEATSTTYAILDAIGNSFFIGLPVFVGFYAMKTFKGTPMLGATLGLILLAPAITSIGTSEILYTLFDGNDILSTPVQSTFFGIPVLSVGAIGYQYSVVPIIVIAWIAAKIERWTKKVSPDAVSLFFVPFTVILVSSVIGLIALGPVVGVATKIVAGLFTWLSGSLPLVFGLLLAGLWQVLVLFGLHWALVPIGLLQLAQYEAGEIAKMDFMTATRVVSFATMGVVLAVMIFEKNKKTNQIAMPAFITGIFGISEPSIYGITLPRKYPFVITCISSAIGGAYVSFMGVGAYTQAGMGIFSLPAFIDKEATTFMGQYDLINLVIGILASFISGFVLTYLYAQAKVGKKEKNNSDAINSPVVGQTIPLTEVKDELFATEQLGPTVALESEDGKVYAPVTGEIITVFPTNHALGIRDEKGQEILIHIGIDTVELNGRHFKGHVKPGDQVNQGDLLIEFDKYSIETEGYETVVLVAITENVKTKKQTTEKLSKDTILFS